MSVAAVRKEISERIHGFDYFSIDYDEEVVTYKFYVGGSSGTLIATATLTYVDSTRADLSSFLIVGSDT